MFARLSYSILLMLAAPVAWLVLLWRARSGFFVWQPWAAERFARYPQPWDGPSPIWVHVASVGEVRAAKPLVRALVLQGHRVVLTHFTPTGWTEGQRVLADEIRQGLVSQQWFPYDFEGAMRRFLRHFNPSLIVLIEREVWPNLMHVARAQAVPVVLASARLSEKSVKRMAWINRLFGGLLYHAYHQVTLALAQSEADAQRLFDVGVPHVCVAGNLKFDMVLPHVAVQAGRHWRETLNRPLVAIASTREGEDKPFVTLIKARLEQSTPQTGQAVPLYLLIPRHPQRFDDAARLLDAAGCRYARWSVLREDPHSADYLPELDVVLGDTMGEMPFFYAAADVAVVGGSFEAHGGQNFIEACALGTPVIIGPHTFNFADAVTSALQAQAVVQVQTPAEAFRQVETWLLQPDAGKHVGDAARAWVAQHMGATERMMQAITDLGALRD